MKLQKYVPNVYQKTIFDIDYDKLKNKNITCLLFDLDNTIVPAKNENLTQETIELFESLKNKFDIYIVSNNISKRRVARIAKKLGVKFTNFAQKPKRKAFEPFVKKGYNKSELVIIGDQVLTDIVGGNNFGIYTILVDPIAKDFFVTYINRFKEKIILKKTAEHKLLTKGKYYE